jgi:hypothetical protein
VFRESAATMFGDLTVGMLMVHSEFCAGANPKTKSRPQRCCARSGGLMPHWGVVLHAVPFQGPDRRHSVGCR